LLSGSSESAPDGEKEMVDFIKLTHQKELIQLLENKIRQYIANNEKRYYL